MMIDLPITWAFVGYLFVSVLGYIAPDVFNLGSFIHYDHAVSAKITKPRNPDFFKSRNGFVAIIE